ncbi:TetR/AcrR family transcriptional regulator [Actinocorallia sp. A-T 12471]|uniref:TetR/AcrR family transcriptional regulator n=1 Tax=Actinocorallia sp. A-T 12471 TaxID=3089813 RepID=UPI0029CB04D7|nr:TetR/AcrR family transcriptional regulator [Actinocorallia sp. A-T 12471]MDX6741553.1 TetR/AcrR family transcriptional regulator [Actinocorallia sp. A-T 12471]
MREEVTRERVIDVATRLFAGLGYDMTSLELVADSVGVSVSTVVGLAGDKRQLYLQMMDRMYEEHRGRIQEVIDRTESPYEAAHQIADAYMDVFLANPDLLALWAQRWASDATGIPEVEDLYTRPLMQMSARKIKDVVPPDLGPYAFLGVVIWCVNGFLSTGLLAPKKGMLRSDDVQARNYFRAILHIIVDRMLAPPPTTPPPA